MTLTLVWFILIAALWTGFFILEGFDLGVGMLHGVVGKDEAGKQTAISTIGPHWDGNEVWLVVAGASMFAAFPGWYATMFSGFYLALVLLLAGLIVRGVSFEFRGKTKSIRRRRVWDGLMTAGSLLVPFLIGVALANLLSGVPINANQEFTGSLLDLLKPYTLFAGLTLVLLCVLHGATFLVLKTTGDLRARATRVARLAAPFTGVAVLVFASWSHVSEGKGFFPNVAEVIAVFAVFAAAWLVGDGREGWAFTATTVAIATTVLSIFVDLYPRVMVSSTNPAYSLTTSNTASGHYALTVMTIVALVFLPLVVLYQGWTYYVFRQRIRTPGEQAPVAPAGSGPTTPTVAQT